MFYHNFHLMNVHVEDSYLIYKVSCHAVVEKCMNAARQLISKLKLNLIVVDPAGSLPTHNTFLVKEVSNG